LRVGSGRLNAERTQRGEEKGETGWGGWADGEDREAFAELKISARPLKEEVAGVLVRSRLFRTKGKNGLPRTGSREVKRKNFRGWHIRKSRVGDHTHQTGPM